MNINAYHQPGVEAGKKAAASVLSLQDKIVTTLEQTKQPLTIADIADKIGEPENVEIVYKIARHLDANDRCIQLEGDLGRPATLKASAIVCTFREQ